jgi:hypothetical protein
MYLRFGKMAEIWSIIGKQINLTACGFLKIITASAMAIHEYNLLKDTEGKS